MCIIIIIDNINNNNNNKIIIMKIQLQKLKYVTNPGQNGQIPQFLEIFNQKTLFRK